MFNNLRIHRYIDTPDCPRCGSKRTGIYIYTPNNFSAVSIIEERNRLRKGQLTRTTPTPLIDLGYNMFCDECDASWTGKYKILYLTKTEIKQKLEEKYIDKEEVNETYKVDKKLRKENKPVNRFKRRYLSKEKPVKKEDYEDSGSEYEDAYESEEE